MLSVPATLLLMLVHTSLIAGEFPMPCDLKPAPGCTCWHRYGEMTISCNHAGLTAVPNLKSNSPHLKLYKLELSYNNITTIGARDLMGTEVQHLVLSHNQIGHIDDDAFKDMLYTMRTLDLSYNELSYIPNFPEASALSNIDLEYNNIQSLPHVFQQVPPGIRHINMAHNFVVPFQETVDGAFASLPLESLSFGPVESFAFENLFVVRNRALKHLRIVGASMEITERSVRSIRKMSRVEELELDDCRIWEGSDYRHVYVTLAQRLRVLSITNADLRKVPAMLYKLKKLRTLDLSYNMISELSPTDFGDLDSLQYLSLHHNEIAHVSAFTFAHLGHIQEIDLSHNALQTLLAEAFDTQELMYSTILLRGNPWICDCGIRWIIDATMEELEGNPGPISSYEMHHSLTCALPPPLKDMKISQVADSPFYEAYVEIC